MRQTETTDSAPGNSWAVRVLLSVVVAVVAGCIAYALVLTGSPGEQRGVRLDQERVSHLSNISDNIDLYWELNGELPADLSQMSGPRYFINRIDDPETGLPYEYRILEAPRYELCAIFSTDTADLPERDRPFSERAWNHGAGRTCFQLEAQSPRNPGR